MFINEKNIKLIEYCKVCKSNNMHTIDTNEINF